MPSNISQCWNPWYLSLEKNCLENKIPNLHRLWKLQVLSFAKNQLTGPSRKGLGGITSLVSIDLSGNMLNETILSMTNLIEFLDLDLNLDNNNFTRFEMPKTPGAKSLKHLFVSRNQLEVMIPSHMKDMLNLEVLNMSNNFFFGEIPFGLTWQLNHNFWLDLLENQLTGQIPSNLLKSTLQYLVSSMNLLHNLLTSKIPIPLDGPEERLLYTMLDLSHNQLSGLIPFLNNIDNTQIYSLWMQHNKLLEDIVNIFAYSGGFDFFHELQLDKNLFTEDLSRIISIWSNL